MKGSPVRVRASAQRKGPARGPFLSGVKELTPWSLVADPCQDDAAMIAAACSSSRQGAACRGSVAGMSYRSPAQKARTRRTKAERRRRQALIAQHVALYGWVCPGYGRPWHESRDLTADHLVPVARGDSEQGTIRVLCRSCNSRRGAGGYLSIATSARASPTQLFAKETHRGTRSARFLGPGSRAAPSQASKQAPTTIRRWASDAEKGSQGPAAASGRTGSRKRPFPTDQSIKRGCL
jgi:hypothetical protein